MTKKNIWSIIMLAVLTLPLMVSCSKDGDDNPGGGYTAHVVIDKNGKASNGAVFTYSNNEFYLDYVKYTIKEGHLVVTGYDKTGFKGVANIVASITYGESYYEVLSIGYGAFSSCEKLSSLYIPYTVTTIDHNAFADCRGLTTVNIPDNVTAVGNMAFARCTGLTSVTISPKHQDNLRSIFSRCYNIKTINGVEDGSIAIQMMVGEWNMKIDLMQVDEKGDTIHYADYVSRGVIPFMTYNTDDQKIDSIYVDDLGEIGPVKAKVGCDLSNFTLSGKDVPNLYDGKEPCQVTGRVMPDATTNQYGKTTDSICVDFVFSTKPNYIYRYAGLRKTD